VDFLDDGFCGGWLVGMERRFGKEGLPLKAKRWRSFQRLFLVRKYLK
jgi:hypothetical protein